MTEIQRRIDVKAEVAERFRLQALEEAKEVNILKREKAEQDEKVRELDAKILALQILVDGSSEKA